MLLAIDAGNTNIVFALFDGDKIRHSWRCRTEAGRTADEYTSWLYPLFQKEGIALAAVKAAVISSVVPMADFNLQTLCRETFGVTPLMANYETAGMSVTLPHPESVGADRLVNAVAVLRDYRAPAIVIDFGTATTFDVINAKGEYCGGVIAPGINLSAEALYMAAAKLPRVIVERPAAVTGTDTISAMQSGLYWGYVGLIEGLLARLISESGERPVVIATGGLANLLSKDIPAIEKADDDLTLRGLLYIHQHKK
jgi:type III pantothenate kinase